MSKFKHFDFGERQKTERWLREEKSLRWIANRLGRSVSSVSDEIRGNSVQDIYDAKKAERKAYTRRHEAKRDCLKVAMDADLKKYVITQMKDEQSPEGISGRIKHVEKHLQYASQKAIYKFVASPHGRQIEKYLHSKAVKKKPGKKRGTSVGIDGRTFIDRRPQKVLERMEFGHFEGDFVESGKGGKGSLLVLVERKTRYPFLVYLEDRTNTNVNRLVHELLVGVSLKSLTLDNDISFQKHEALSLLINATVYFCHPQSPHENGTVENRNKAIRRYVKKKSDLSSFSLEYFKMVETKLRTRFMTCLNYQTPQEAFEAELKKQKNTQMRGMMRRALTVN
ncbi:MAG: Integrase, catalytic region [Parcubacteria group bacterium GW2011_GWA1_47_8]|nr:MAG: Integrase, catalytic region [Parcubacteria group bacterium GW2011_GWA1_47_8]KKW07818.1 MAG: Integrase, catalytic region [Parcubacteria group bacterium GW2011_GWA2_49_16]